MVNFGLQTKSYRRVYRPTQAEFRRDFRQFSTLIHQVLLLQAAFVPPKIVSAVGLAAPGGLSWALPDISTFLFYFFRYEISELPRPIAVKLCHTITIRVRFIMQVQQFEHSPEEIGAKNMQNSARFETTSDFDREYLRNGSRYPKSERQVMINDSSRVPPKKSGELWSTNYRELYVSLNPPKIAFFGRLYFGP